MSWPLGGGAAPRLENSPSAYVSERNPQTKQTMADIWALQNIREQQMLY